MGHVGTIICNNGDNIYIPNIEFGTADVISVSQNQFYYSNGENYAIKPNWYPYITQVNSKGSLGSNYNEVYTRFTELRTSQPEAYWSSGAGKSKLDFIDSKCVWLWGSLSQGGVCLCKDDNYDYYLAAFRGIYEDTTNPGQIAYWFQYGMSRGLTQSELSNGYFCSFGSPKPLYIFFQPDGLFYRSNNYTSLPLPTTEVGISIDNVMSNPNWASVLPTVVVSGVCPVNMFCVCDAEGHYFTSQGYMKIGDNDEGVYPQYNLVAGSIWGGSEFSMDDNPYGSTSTTSPTGDPWDDTSDKIPATDDTQFTTDAINSGFYTLYNPTKGEIQAFNNYLFTDITDAMSQILKRLIADPIEYVVFCAMCHFTPPSSTTANISFCGLNTGISANLISKQMHPIDCGSVELFYIGSDGLKHDDTSSFLSYDPYYKIQIYLPYIGIKDLKTSDVQRGTLTVKYWVDLLTGACIAQLIVNRDSRGAHDVYLDAVIAEFTGNCYEHLPMSATDWRGMATSILQFAGGAASVASGNAAGLGTMASAVMAEKVTVARSGQLAANYGYMGCQTPYLIISRPINQTPDNFKEWEGLPSNITYGISELSGYTEIDPNTLWVNNIPGITEEEAEMIRTICNEGIII